ncbi:MAG: protein translocase subunit SecD [Neisseriaceae bacterium]|nr:protein translocase subunit SecD [Neisseriaceae bacterium]
MNRYPIWKYLIILVVFVVSCVYAVPNLFGETPAVQVSTNRQSIVINEDTMAQIEAELQQNNIQTNGIYLDGNSLKVRLLNAEAQLKARDLIEDSLGEGYITALNLLPDSPTWMANIKANPMFLGLDLRGGVHFLLQVDKKAAVEKKLERYAGDIRRTLRNEKIRYGSIRTVDNALVVPLQDAESQTKALRVLAKELPEVTLTNDGERGITLSMPEALITKIQDDAVKQNMSTLHNRVNELGVAEPVIQQAGPDRIVVQLPGIQDTAKAKDILGRTATLEVRRVEDDAAMMQQALDGNVPVGYELLSETGPGGDRPILINRQVELTGDNINDAQPSFDEKGAAAVAINLDSTGASIFRDLTRNNLKKRMAMVLIEQVPNKSDDPTAPVTFTKKSEVVTAPVIQSEIPNGRVQISGSMNSAEANDVALLLRSGSLAAPMNIVEERTIGPSLGQENITKGFHSTLWGFIVVGGFMMLYYRTFGVFSVLSLTYNLVLLIAILSMLQLTLTLPGIAAIALTLGMAIDANVLINERIREELRAGAPPQMAINAGYKHAWATIVDSNVTSLIAGLALLVFGSGPVRGFAVVHCIGIVTSMFTSVMVSRSFVNIWYGRRHRLKKVSIGSVWRPEDDSLRAGSNKE